MCAKRIKFPMTRLSVCGLGVSCNEMSDTPMLLVVPKHSGHFDMTCVTIHSLAITNFTV